MYTVNCYTILLFFFCIANNIETRKPFLRIIGGRNANPGEYPYVVRMEARDEMEIEDVILKLTLDQCTGSALSRTVILTAAHCCDIQKLSIEFYSKVFNSSIQNMKHLFVARYSSGDGKPSASDITVDILRCILPPSASSHRTISTGKEVLIPDDIALLETQPATLKTFAKISGMDYRTAFGQRVLVMGYGKTNGSDGEMFSTLELDKPLQIVDALWMECELSVYPMACAVQPCDRHIAVCPGDSGGPAMHASGIIGISSFIIAPKNCQVKSDKGRYSFVVYMVPISRYLHWIYDEMAKMIEQ